MTSLEQLLKQQTNPFDRTTLKVFDFWDEPYQQIPIVESIHNDVVLSVEQVLEEVSNDHVTRSIVIAGDSGSGKSVVLGRLRDRLNTKALFVYINSWNDDEYVWRHTLRCIVDSLLKKPVGQQESQLLLWIKNLPILKESGFQKWLVGERKLFINKMKASYPVGIQDSSKFFGVLYDLTNPDLYSIAAEWLKGDDLDEEDLKLIKVNKSIDSEAAARKLIGNFGRIAASTYPIVICFDNLDNIPKLSDDSLDLQPLFDINTTFHAENLKNLLIVISLVTNNWKQAFKHIQQADKAGLYKQTVLKDINLEQAEKVWAARLSPFHQQANPKPKSPIAPLKRENLEKAFPGGKANLRSVLQLGYKYIDSWKGEIGGGETVSDEKKLEAAFRLLWQNELKENQHKISKFRQFSSIELVGVLQNTLASLDIEIAQAKILPSPAYSSYSFSYRFPNQNNPVGVIWTEEPSLNGFCNIMKAAKKLAQLGSCNTLYLIRAGRTGNPKNKGYQLYQEIFTGSPHQHLVPEIESLCYLVTCDRLFRESKAGDLLLLNQVISPKTLKELFSKTQVLKSCKMLQKLGVFEHSPGYKKSNEGGGSHNPQIKQFVLDFVTQHHLVSQGTVIKHAQQQFAGVSEDKIYALLQDFCKENRANILDTTPPPFDQIVCYVPHS